MLESTEGIGSERTSNELAKLRKYYFGNLSWRAVAQYFTLPNVDHSVTSVAAALGLGTKETVEAIESLERLGVLTRTATGYSVKSIVDDGTGADQGEQLRNHLLMSAQLLGRMKIYNRTVFRSSVLATTVDEMSAFTGELTQLIKKYIERSTKLEADKVFALDFKLAEMTSEHAAEESNQ